MLSRKYCVFAGEAHNAPNDVMKRGLDALHMHSALTPRNIACSRDEHGGFTTIGCARGLKQVSRALPECMVVSVAHRDDRLKPC